MFSILFNFFMLLKLTKCSLLHIYLFKQYTTRSIHQMSVFDSLTRGYLCGPDRSYNHWSLCNRAQTSSSGTPSLYSYHRLFLLLPFHLKHHVRKKNSLKKNHHEIYSTSVHEKHLASLSDALSASHATLPLWNGQSV